MASFDYDEKPVYEALTRALNISAAALGLILLAPLLALIALAIKISDPSSPVLYRGRRVGKGGSIYTMFKFRTMAPGTEQRVGASLIEKDSPSITPVGRLLRRRKLDELPQLLNVLRGDMNLVGPRPVREAFLEELRQQIPGYDRRFLVRPGITGLAQVRGGYYTDPAHKIRYEGLYIKRRSVWLDMKLIGATLFVILSRALTMLGLLFSLLAFIVFLPTTFMPFLHVSVLGMRINVAFLLIAALAGGWVVKGLVTRRGFVFRRTPADKYIGIFIVTASFGALLGPYAPRSLLGVLYFCSGAFALYFLATQSIERDVHRIRLYVRMLALVTIGVSAYGVLGYLTGKGAENEAGLRAVSTFGDPNVLALYLSMALPLLLYLLFSSRVPGARVFWGVGAVLAGVCLLLTFSRSGYVSFFSAVPVFLLRVRRNLSYLALAFCAVLVLAAEAADNARFSPYQIATSPSSRRMIQLNAALINGFQEEFLLGVGWRNWEVALGAVDKGNDDGISLGPVSLPRTIKNMYMTLLVEYGLVGLFLILLVLITAMGSIYEGSRKVADPSMRMLLWAIFSSGTGFMANMLFFDSCYFIVAQATFWLLMGFGIGIALEFGGASKRYYHIQQFSH